MEKQKSSIIEALDKMHSNMREYTMNVEDNLEKVYASMGGVQKKFGFTNLNGARNMEDYLDGNNGAKIAAFDRKLEKMSKHATLFAKNIPSAHSRSSQELVSTSATQLPKVDAPRMPKVMGRLPVRVNAPVSTNSVEELIKQVGNS